MRKFFAVFGLIILYMFLVGGLFIAVVALIGLAINFDTNIMIGLGITAGVIYFFSFPLSLNFIIKQVYHFNGVGAPIPEKELRAQILKINDFNAPVMIESKGKKLIATWNYVDAKWYEIIAKSGMKQVYELHIKFDERKNTVRLIDVMKGVEWRAGPDHVKIKANFSGGVNISYKVGKAWGIKENFKLGKIYDYKFKPAEVKNPIFNTILRSGWDVRFAMW